MWSEENGQKKWVCHVKAAFEDGTSRRYKIEAPEQGRFFALHSRTAEVVGNNHIHLEYRDEEGDMILITTDHELDEALEVLTPVNCRDVPLLKLNVTLDKSSNEAAIEMERMTEDRASIGTNTAEEAEEVNARRAEERLTVDGLKKMLEALKLDCGQFLEQYKVEGEAALLRATTPAQTNNAVHLNIVCDGCEMVNIRGSRFKCLVCDDYDLCEKCCFKGMHDEHAMLRIPTPKETEIPWGMPVGGQAGLVRKAMRDSGLGRLNTPKENGQAKENEQQQQQQQPRLVNLNYMGEDIAKIELPNLPLNSKEMQQTIQNGFAMLSGIGEKVQQALQNLGLDVSYDIELEESEKKTEDKKEKESDYAEDDMEAATGDDEEVTEETDKKRREENRQNVADDKREKETDKDKDETQPLNQPNNKFDYSQTAFGWMPTPKKKEQTLPTQKESSSARTRPRTTAEKRDRYADWPEAPDFGFEPPHRRRFFGNEKFGSDRNEHGASPDRYDYEERHTNRYSAPAWGTRFGSARFPDPINRAAAPPPRCNATWNGNGFPRPVLQGAFGRDFGFSPMGRRDPYEFLSNAFETAKAKAEEKQKKMAEKMKQSKSKAEEKSSERVNDIRKYMEGLKKAHKIAKTNSRKMSAETAAESRPPPPPYGFFLPQDFNAPTPNVVAPSTPDQDMSMDDEFSTQMESIRKRMEELEEQRKQLHEKKKEMVQAAKQAKSPSSSLSQMHAMDKTAELMALSTNTAIEPEAEAKTEMKEIKKEEVEQNSMSSSHSSGHGDFQLYDEAADYVSDSSADDGLEIINQTETPGLSSDPFTVIQLVAMGFPRQAVLDVYELYEDNIEKCLDALTNSPLHEGIVYPSLD